MEEAMRLNPKPPDWYFSAAGTAQFFARRPDDAIRWLERAPDALVDTRALLGAASFHTGNVNVGREQIARFLVDFERKISPGQKSTPGEALAWLFRVLPLRRESDAEYLRGGLVGAGL
jgi:hypothetical protein